jgi:NDP-sugar pyrophosphorylase family protein
MVRKAFILSAGLGTRLGKLTEEQPKALVEVMGIPMLQLTIDGLMKQGITDILVNVHHFPKQIMEFILKKDSFGANLKISDESGELLDTGGAIWKASGFFEGNEPVLVHNVDVLSNVDIQDMSNQLEETDGIALLCIRKRASGRALLFDNGLRLAGWTDTREGRFKWVRNPLNSYLSFGYSGIFLAKGAFARHLPYRGRFSLIDAWLKMAAEFPIYGYPDPGSYWFDLGTPEKIEAAETFLKARRQQDI